MKCENCKFWNRFSSVLEVSAGEKGWYQVSAEGLPIYGQCRINPPQVVNHTVSSRNAWPLTLEQDWCGQFTQNPKPDKGGAKD